MRLSEIVAKVAVSDLVAVAAGACLLYGLALLHPAAPWIGAGLGGGFVSVELGKREAASRRQE